jgi:hypothetical protein
LTRLPRPLFGYYFHQVWDTIALMERPGKPQFSSGRISSESSNPSPSSGESTSRRFLSCGAHHESQAIDIVRRQRSTKCTAATGADAIPDRLVHYAHRIDLAGKSGDADAPDRSQRLTTDLQLCQNLPPGGRPPARRHHISEISQRLRRNSPASKRRGWRIAESLNCYLLHFSIDRLSIFA